MPKATRQSQHKIGGRTCCRQGRHQRWRKLVLALCLLLLYGQYAVPPAARAQLNTILVAVDKNYPPFTFIDETGTLVGFEIDLLRELAQINGWQVLFEPVSFANLIPGVSTRLYDAAISCIFITEARKKLVNFSDPYYSSGMWLIALRGSNIRTITDLTPATKVGTVPGTAWETYTSERTNAQIIYSENAVAVFDNIVNGNIAATINEREVLMGYLAEHPDAPLQTIGPPLTYDECAIVVNVGQPRFLAALNEALAQTKANGRFDQMYRHWFGDLEPMVKPATEPTVAQGQALPPLTPMATTSPVTTVVTATPATLAGVYLLTLQTVPPSFEIVTLTADQLWVGTQSIQTASPVTGAPSPPTYQGVWTVDANQQIRATTLNFQTTTQPTRLARRDYQMRIDPAGQINGAYTLDLYPLDVNPLLTAAPLAATMTITFTGERLSMTKSPAQ